jgi:hypothetical protein
VARCEIMCMGVYVAYVRLFFVAFSDMAFSQSARSEARRARLCDQGNFMVCLGIWLGGI